MDGTPSPFDTFHKEASTIERQMDALASAAYDLVYRFVVSDHRLRLLQETYEAITAACDGLDRLSHLVDECRELSRHLQVRNQEEAS
jgi:hypothetical protein